MSTFNGEKNKGQIKRKNWHLLDKEIKARVKVKSGIIRGEDGTLLKPYKGLSPDM